MDKDLRKDLFSMSLDVVLKATPPGDDGRRLVGIEASSPDLDAEQDTILQKALLDSADYYLSYGNIDIDHLTTGRGRQMGHFLAHEPAWYEIGRPIEVKDAGNHRTMVIGEIFRSPDGVSDPEAHAYDLFWESLQTLPPARWRASIGASAIEATPQGRNTKGIIVKGMRWNNLALTKNPVNYSLENVNVVTATEFVKSLQAGITPETAVDTPYLEHTPPPEDLATSMYETLMAHKCPYKQEEEWTLKSLRVHYQICEGDGARNGILYAHAMVDIIGRYQRRARRIEAYRLRQGQKK